MDRETYERVQIKQKPSQCECRLQAMSVNRPWVGRCDGPPNLRRGLTDVAPP